MGNFRGFAWFDDLLELHDVEPVDLIGNAEAENFQRRGLLADRIGMGVGRLFLLYQRRLPSLKDDRERIDDGRWRRRHYRQRRFGGNGREKVVIEPGIFFHNRGRRRFLLTQGRRSHRPGRGLSLLTFALRLFSDFGYVHHR